ALAAGAGRVAFAGPAKTDAELDAALRAGVPTVVNVESLQELRRLDLAAARLGATADVGLRVNRRDAAPPGTHRMSGAAAPFGVDEETLPELIAVARSSPRLRLRGLHLHAVSNNLDAAAHAEFVAGCVAFARGVAAAHDVDLAEVNVGGGFGVDPVGARVFDLDVFAAAMRGLDVGEARVVFELGRFLVSEAGWYAVEVVDVKTVRGRVFAVVRGGTHHFRLPAAWGYDHPAAVAGVDDWPYPWRRPGVDDAHVDVVGELCTPRDVLCRGLRVARLRVGDVLAFPRTGAYGWEVSHKDFLSHPHPRSATVG
ncbi:MAG: type III PLP-dependent enzyme, partial [Stackebrandtia sp.]